MSFHFSIGVTNIIRSQDDDGQSTVQFDIHEKLVLLGFAKVFKFQLTVKEVQESVATHMSANLMDLMGGWFQLNQGFHMTDYEDGGTLLEGHCQYAAPRFFARYIRGVGLAQHTAITVNTRKYFMKESQQNPSI